MDHEIPDATIRDPHVSVARLEDVAIPVLQVMDASIVTPSFFQCFLKRVIKYFILVKLFQVEVD